jgi:hypothetical protein
MSAAFIGKPGLGRLQPVQDVIRRSFKPGADMPGQLQGDTRHPGGMGFDLMPDADGGNLLPALLQLPRTRRQLGQGRAVQRDGPDGMFQRLGLVALLLGDMGQLQRLDALRLKGAVVDPLAVAGQLQGVNRRAKLTPYRRPKLTPLVVSRSGPEPTELITEWRRVRP